MKIKGTGKLQVLSREQIELLKPKVKDYVIKNADLTNKYSIQNQIEVALHSNIPFRIGKREAGKIVTEIGREIKTEIA